MQPSLEQANKENSIRTFFAIPLPGETAKKLYMARQNLRDAWSGIRWIPPQNYHITLCFIGDVRNTEIPAIIDAAAPILEDVKPFPVEFAGPGMFGPKQNPRVLLEKIADTDNMLQSLRLALLPALKNWTRWNENSFRPHVTLGRAKRSGITRSDVLLKAADTHANIAVFQASGVVLFKSELLPTGAVYTPIYNFGRT